MKSFLRPIIFFLLTVVSITTAAQNQFQKEIDQFKHEDSLSVPGKGKILFVGSSSFRLWKDLQRDFPNHPLINRGFGGSTFTDLLFFKEDIIKPYAPRQVVIYCGENDLAGGATPQKVLSDFKAFFQYIRKHFPKSYIAFVSIKPSPSRKHILNSVRQANKLISDYIASQKRAVYVDIFSPMLDSAGNFREELFVEDRLHMNRQGYDIWKKALQPHLK
jgi:lysophospholipase L1-like esterase